MQIDVAGFTFGGLEKFLRPRKVVWMNTKIYVSVGSQARLRI
jgi:hypothetical protein